MNCDLYGKNDKADNNNNILSYTCAHPFAINMYPFCCYKGLYCGNNAPRIQY